MARKTLHRLVIAALLASSATQLLAANNGLDGSFGAAGLVTLGTTPTTGQHMWSVNALAYQQDSKILLAGRADDLANPGSAVPAIGRLNPDGRWDTLPSYRIPPDSTALR